MAIGKRKSGGDFLPILKFNAKEGELRLVNRIFEGGEWSTRETDVTQSFKAIADMEGLMVGWIKFPANSAPQTQLVPAGEDYGEAPTKDYREGVRLIFKMSREIDGSTREFMSTAIGVWAAIDELHDAYEEAAPDHPGKLPIVRLAKVVEQSTKQGTVYAPQFEIVGWADRPADMPVMKVRPVKPKTLSEELNDDVPF